MSIYKYTNYNLIQELCKVHAPSGSEHRMKAFLLDYINTNQNKWKVKPEVIHGSEFQDCLILKFGEPTTAVFAHMDSIGFTVRYHDQLIPIGSPDSSESHNLCGSDAMGEIECTLRQNQDGNVFYDFPRAIETGTTLVYSCDFRDTPDFISSCYLDNRLGIFATLRLAEELENGLIVFSAFEEHGGGSVPFLARYMVEEHGVLQALVADITWVTEGVQPGNGVVISLRDRNIPRQTFLERILSHAEASEIPFQLEVEGGGSSDGRELQQSPYAIDWCFIGAPEQNVHTPDEKVHKNDIDAMVEMYKNLMAHL